MKKGLSKPLCLVLSAAILVAMAACNSSTPSASDTSATSADVSVATSSERIKLAMLDMKTEEAVKGSVEGLVYREAVNSFKAENPNLQLEEEVISHEVYETKVKTLAAANELPDIFEALPSFMKQFYDNDQILDLKPLMAADSEWGSRFPDGSLGDMTFGENVLATPRVAIANHVILWNTEIFKKCGIEKFPANSDEFKVAVKTLKDNGYIPLACGNKGKYLISSQIMPGILFKFASADWYESLKNNKGAKFTDPAPLAAITYLDELMKMGLFNEDVNSIEPQQARALYYDEKAAMCLEGSWVISNFINETTQDIRDKTDITIFPQVADKPELANQIVGGQGWGSVLSSRLKDKPLALACDFLKRLTSPEAQGKLVEGGSLAVVENALYDKSKLDPFFNEFLSMYNSYTTIVGCPEVQLSVDYMDASYTGYQELSIGSITPQQLAEKLQAAQEAAQ